MHEFFERRSRAIAGLSMTLAAAGLAIGEARAGEPIAFACTLSWASKTGTGLTREAICAAFARELAAAMTQPVRRIESVPEAPDSPWIRAHVRIQPLDRAEVLVTSHFHGTTMNHPAAAVQVMDKPLGLREIDRLARLAAAGVSNHRRQQTKARQ